MQKLRRNWHTRDMYEIALYSCVGIDPVDTITFVEKGRKVYMYVYDQPLPKRSDIKVVVTMAGETKVFPLLSTPNELSYQYMHRENIMNIRKLKEQDNDRTGTD